ncbi:hypothetical protein BH09MYX1_BH09MYX1_50240 [soil metagenome]
MRASLLLLALLALLAAGCAWSRPSRIYPAWRATDAAAGTPFQCAKATPVVVKTGKTGVGITMIFDGGDATCVLALTDVVLFVEDRDVAHAKPPRMPTLAPCVRVEMYFPFFFDENSSFNAGERTGALVLKNGQTSTAFPLALDPAPGTTK